MLADGLYDVPAGKVAVIVTHLEMTGPAPRRPVSLPDGIHFRRVVPDIEWYRNIFRRVGAEWLWYGRLKMPDTTLTAILSDPAVEVFTLSRGGEDHALLELDFREDGACELAYFGVTPQLIGSGSGRYLMNEAITRAWEKPIKSFHVHTCTTDSPQALDFYRRSGFEPLRQQVEIDDDPRVLGLLSRDSSPQAPIFKL